MKKALPNLLAPLMALALVFGLLSCGGSNKDVPVSGVSLDMATITLAPGGTVGLTATVSPSNATNSNVTWSSSNRSVATVSGAGSRATVAALANGEATITVRTEDGGKTATCAVTVVIPATSVTLDKESFLRLPIGGSSTLTATILPDSASSYGVIWTSDAPNIASVSGNGLNATVTALADGWATITATTAYGGKTATCKVAVSDDPYDTEFALRDALAEFWPKIQGRNLTEEEQAKYSDELKEVFVKAYARDSYSKNLPFSSEEIRKGFTGMKYRFNYSDVWQCSSSGTIDLGTLYNDNNDNGFLDLPMNIIHEVGHYWGLDENTTDLLSNKYVGNKLDVNSNYANVGYLLYSPFYDNLLAQKLGGDEKIWNILRSPNATGEFGKLDKEYGELWNKNMTVTVNGQESTLVEYSNFQMARRLSWADATGYGGIAQGYKNFSGVKNIFEEFKKMGVAFEKALKTNDIIAIEQVRDLFKSIVEYRETLKEDETKSLLSGQTNLGGPKAIVTQSICHRQCPKRYGITLGFFSARDIAEGGPCLSNRPYSPK